MNLFLLSIIFYSKSLIQDTDSLKNLTVEKLCSSNFKEWTFEKVVEHLGSSCIRGKTYTFYRSGKLSIRECIAKEWKITNTSWTYGKVDDLDIHIIVDNKEFILLINDHPKIKGAQKMILRKIIPGSISTPTRDLEFIYEDE